MRRLASIQKIENIRPIEGRDFIEQGNILGWNIIIKKGEFKNNDLVIFIEPDSVLPNKPEFEFLKDKKFRIKTMKLKGTLSQGICFPMSILPKSEEHYKVEDDVTDIIGVTKYESESEREDKEVVIKDKYKNPIIKFLLKFSLFRKLLLSKKENRGFPDFVSKTDETRIQNIPHILKDKNTKYVVREKVDGQSGTFIVKKNKPKHFWNKETIEYIVCSRNMRLWKEDLSKSYWKVSNKYDIQDVLVALLRRFDVDWVCLQGECVDTNVQGNKYKVKEADLYAFNLITPKGKINCLEGEAILKEFRIKWCPLIDDNYTVPDTIDEILNYATGQSKLYPTLREGYVFRNYSKNISFKAVSPDFLIKNDE